jgi:hypothetical protein
MQRCKVRWLKVEAVEQIDAGDIRRWCFVYMGALE